MNKNLLLIIIVSLLFSNTQECIIILAKKLNRHETKKMLEKNTTKILKTRLISPWVINQVVVQVAAVEGFLKADFEI